MIHGLLFLPIVAIHIAAELLQGAVTSEYLHQQPVVVHRLDGTRRLEHFEGIAAGFKLLRGTQQGHVTFQRILGNQIDILPIPFKHQHPLPIAVQPRTVTIQFFTVGIELLHDQSHDRPHLSLVRPACDQIRTRKSDHDTDNDHRQLQPVIAPASAAGAVFSRRLTSRAARTVSAATRCGFIARSVRRLRRSSLFCHTYPRLRV